MLTVKVWVKFIEKKDVTSHKLCSKIINNKIKSEWLKNEIELYKVFIELYKLITEI